VENGQKGPAVKGNVRPIIYHVSECLF